MAESTLNTWVSTPCFVPVRRPNERSESRRGELFPGPEWTNLPGGEKGVGWERVQLGSDSITNNNACNIVCLRGEQPGVERSGEIEGREKVTHRFWVCSCFSNCPTAPVMERVSVCLVVGAKKKKKSH